MVFVGSKDNSVYAIGSIIRVPEDYPTIQEAIDAADSGDTIIVAPGTYNESLVINKTLTILGLEGSSTDFAGGGSGIAVTIQPDAPGTIIDNVVITNWDQGIFINDTSDCQIYGNVMYYMSDSGIVVKGNNAANNLIEDNVVYSNNIAINVTKSATSNIIYNNTITANNVGLYLESGGNLIYNNTISQNNVGINMDDSDNNIIYHNNFVDNANAQVITSTSINNDWDNGSEGNYWSDYTGTDADGDGKGDTPYIIDGNNQDDCPLMSPYEYWSNPMCGDINKDMKVNAQDLLFLAAAYGATPGEENWHPNCDFNNDNKIDALDLVDLCKNYGRTA
jgi:parallel beta-helix repeat protein